MRGKRDGTEQGQTGFRGTRLYCHEEADQRSCGDCLGDSPI
jgi:hypothetical protein